MTSFRHRLRCRRPRPKEPGYALPLAIGASGLLFLGSVTLLGVGMQERLDVGAMEQLQRDEDLLASAAHKLLSVLNSAHRCLLNEPLTDWEARGAGCNADAATVAALKNAQVMDAAVQVMAWQPGTRAQTMQLALQLNSGRQARYEVQLAATTPEAARLGPRLLGGVQP
jgi:hypothetical protein